MTSNKKLFNVEIAGTSLKIRTSNDETLVEELVQLVDTKVNQALAVSGSNSMSGATLVAALNIAEEFILLKRQARAELERLGQKTENILSDLEFSQKSQTVTDH